MRAPVPLTSSPSSRPSSSVSRSRGALGAVGEPVAVGVDEDRVEVEGVDGSVAVVVGGGRPGAALGEVGDAVAVGVDEVGVRLVVVGAAAVTVPDAIEVEVFRTVVEPVAVGVGEGGVRGAGAGVAVGREGPVGGVAVDRGRHADLLAVGQAVAVRVGEGGVGGAVAREQPAAGDLLAVEEAVVVAVAVEGIRAVDQHLVVVGEAVAVAVLADRVEGVDGAVAVGVGGAGVLRIVAQAVAVAVLLVRVGLVVRRAREVAVEGAVEVRVFRAVGERVAVAVDEGGIGRGEAGIGIRHEGPVGGVAVDRGRHADLLAVGQAVAVRVGEGGVGGAVAREQPAAGDLLAVEEAVVVAVAVEGIRAVDQHLVVVGEAVAVAVLADRVEGVDGAVAVGVGGAGVLHVVAQAVGVAVLLVRVGLVVRRAWEVAVEDAVEVRVFRAVGECVAVAVEEVGVGGGGAPVAIFRPARGARVGAEHGHAGGRREAVGQGVGQHHAGLLAVGEAVVVGVGEERIGGAEAACREQAEGVHLVAVRETVIVRVCVVGEGALHQDLVAVLETIAVGVAVEGVGKVDEDLVHVGEAVAVGVGGGEQATVVDLAFAVDVAGGGGAGAIGVVADLDAADAIVGRDRGAGAVGGDVQHLAATAAGARAMGLGVDVAAVAAVGGDDARALAVELGGAVHEDGAARATATGRVVRRGRAAVGPAGQDGAGVEHAVGAHPDDAAASAPAATDVVVAVGRSATATEARVAVERVGHRRAAEASFWKLADGARPGVAADAALPSVAATAAARVVAIAAPGAIGQVALSVQAREAADADALALLTSVGEARVVHQGAAEDVAAIDEHAAAETHGGGIDGAVVVDGAAGEEGDDATGGAVPGLGNDGPTRIDGEVGVLREGDDLRLVGDDARDQGSVEGEGGARHVDDARELEPADIARREVELRLVAGCGDETDAAVDQDELASAEGRGIAHHDLRVVREGRGRDARVVVDHGGRGDHRRAILTVAQAVGVDPGKRRAGQRKENEHE